MILARTGTGGSLDIPFTGGWRLSDLICGAIVWASTYRLAYALLNPNHFRLLAVLLFLAWLFMGYAVARHRLLNRKVFISRKIVYSFVAPAIFASYLLAVGVVSLIMRTFELPFPLVLQWFLLALGLVAIGLFALSGQLRRRVHFCYQHPFLCQQIRISGRMAGTFPPAPGGFNRDRCGDVRASGSG